MKFSRLTLGALCTRLVSKQLISDDFYQIFVSVKFIHPLRGNFLDFFLPWPMMAWPVRPIFGENLNVQNQHGKCISKGIMVMNSDL